MNKPEIPPLPGMLVTNNPATTPKAVVHQPAPVGEAASQHRVSPTRPAAPAKTAPYVDPYLFETGYYASRAEYEELSRTVGDRIQLRAEAEKAPTKRRVRRIS